VNHGGSTTLNAQNSPDTQRVRGPRLPSERGNSGCRGFNRQNGSVEPVEFFGPQLLAAALEAE